MKQELRYETSPCPFCKCKDGYMMSDGDQYWVECTKCKARGSLRYSPDSALWHWISRERR